MRNLRRHAVRLSATAAVVASLVWCATALATGRQYNGPAGSAAGAGVEFNAKLTRGRPTLVRRFEFHNIPAACKGYAATAVTDSLTLTMPVGSDRRFKGTASLNQGREKVVVHGRFAKGFGKATGTLTVRGPVSGCGAADTGVVTWKAPAV